ncbi:MAG: HD domain-containing protein [Candidatus Omnitrophota bacterium]
MSHILWEDRPLLKVVLNFAKSRNIKPYIVGGYLRDILLKRQRPNPDIDFALKKDAISFGRALAKDIKAGFVVLDREHGACRLVKRMKGRAYTLDFTDFRGATLEEDLLRRDFTINTLCLEPGSDSFIDLYNAAGDLKKKIIRLVNKDSFDEDPLRILRAFSFSCILGFKIEDDTLKRAVSKKSKLKGVSFERIRDELFKILDSSRGYNCFRELDKSGILKVLFPELEAMRGVTQGPYHHLDVWGHSLETFKNMEAIIRDKKNNREIQEYLDKVISAQRQRKSLVKLAALLHDIGKPRARRRKGKKLIFHGHERLGAEIAERIAKRLKLSNDELSALKRIIFLHLRPGYLSDNEVLTPRAKFRFYRDAQDETISTLLVSLADQRATRGRLTTKTSRERHEKLAASLIRQYFKEKNEKKPARLVNGDDLIREFKLKPSPLIGKILREIEELQAIGRVKTKKEALDAARKFMNKNLVRERP